MRIINLSSFNENDLNPSETILKRARGHWVFFIAFIFKFIFWLAALGVVTYFLISFEILAFNTGVADLSIWILIIVSFLYVTFVMFLKDWINWFYDQYIVTNERVVFLNQHYLFGKDIYSIELDRIEEVSLRYCSIFGTIFNYADVEVRTPSEGYLQSNQLTMRRIYKARKMQNIIINAINDFKERKNMQK